ncbi:MAG: trigger factor [Desulfuromonadales bacterium]|nr:trigger factor [Desulfuromonadales bacterium]
MNVTVEDLSPIKKKLTIEVNADLVASELDGAFKKIAKTANIKGFRKGKVPKQILEQQYGPKAHYDTIGSLINNSLYKAMIDHQVEAVSQPEVVQTGAIEKGQAFSYEAEVEVRPEIKAQHYTGLELEKEKLVFDDSAVDQQLEQMLQSKVQLVAAPSDSARDNDTVVIDFTGYIDGEAFENGAAQDYQLELGSNSFIPGFEAQVVGMKRDEEKDVNVTFPEAYGAESLAGKDAVFKVLLKEIKEKKIPVLDDDFAKEMDADSLEQLKEKIRDNLKAQQQQQIDSQLQENLMNALLEKNPFDLPDGMVTNQLMYLKDSFSQRLKAQGMSLEMLGMNDENFNKTYWDMATQQVKGELLLDAIAKQEQIVVEEAEVEQKFADFAEQSNTPLAQVKKFFENDQALRGLKGQLLQEKVSAFLLDKAVVTEVEPKSPADGNDSEDAEKES